MVLLYVSRSLKMFYYANYKVDISFFGELCIWYIYLNGNKPNPSILSYS